MLSFHRKLAPLAPRAAPTSPSLFLLPLLPLLLLQACVGSIGDGVPGDDTPGTRNVKYPPGYEAGASDVPAPSPRTVRLTHTQWENTVRDLFALTDLTGLSTEFRTDGAGTSLFANEAGVLEVDGALWSGYQRASSTLAERVASDAAYRETIEPDADGTPDERAAAFVEGFLTRAYRRKPTEGEQTRHLALFGGGAEVFPAADPFAAGMAIVVEAALQSPHFLYRVETSTETSAGKIPLGDYEVASRLSYTLWNSLPDDVLFSQAAAGELAKPAAVKEEIERMLADPKAAEVVSLFHRVLFAADRFHAIDPDREKYTTISENFGEYAFLEQGAVIRDKLFDRDLGLRALLTEPTTFVNAELARIYGLEGEFTDETFEAVNLDDTQRAGLLTQTGFLALNASSRDGDPIHRGVYILDRLTCTPLTAPDAIPPLPAAVGQQTMRERVKAHTEQPGTACATCHATSINPLGFPFEHFDGIGGYRTEDNGQPVDSTSTVTLDGVETPVTDALTLSNTLAESEQVHRCYAEHWLEYAYARDEDHTFDEPLLDRVAQLSRGGDASTKEAILALLLTDSFLTRSTTELPEDEQ